MTTDVPTPGAADPATPLAHPEIPASAAPIENPGIVARLAASRDSIISALFTLVSVLIMGVVVATLVVSYRPLKTRTSEVKAAPVSVVFYWPAVSGNPAPPQGVASSTWVNTEIRTELEKLALGLLSSDPLDTASLNQTRDALLSTGWFNKDLRLARDQHNAVHIRGTWKYPAAAVRAVYGSGAGFDQLVSSKGELLPPKYKPDASGLKVIVGVKNEPPALGEPWIGGDVQAGLQLLEYLAVLPPDCFRQVSGVDVSEYSPDRRLTIITDLGNRILWGGPPEEFSPGQASPQTKLARLAQMHRDLGRVDANRLALDIRLTDGTYIVDTLGLTTTPEPEDPKKTGKKPAAAQAPQQARGNTHRR